MQLETNTGVPLTKEALKEILNGFPVAYLKPSDINVSNDSLPAFKKLGVLVDLDELEEAEETIAKQQLWNANTTHAQSYYCIECHRQLPTAHLLDLHISEQHDSYFAASVERGNKPMFACYIEECGIKFHNVGERKDHCIAVHKFPANYRFDQANITKNKNRKKESEDSMDVDNEAATKGTQLPYIKAFSFGHPTQRTFHTRKNKGDSGKALLDVKEMQDALNDMN